MAQLGETRRNMESAFLNDYWKLRKEMGQPEDNEEYWQTVMGRLCELADKYDRNSYICEILLACLDDLEWHRPDRPGYCKGGDPLLKFVNNLRKKKGLPLVGVVK